MHLLKEHLSTTGTKLILEDNGKRVARVFVYFLYNNLHSEPLAVMEDLFVEEYYRGKGFGRKMIDAVIDEARNKGCYKLICCSRDSNRRAHELYLNIGFSQHGKEFRMDMK